MKEKIKEINWEASLCACGFFIVIGGIIACYMFWPMNTKLPLIPILLGLFLTLMSSKFEPKNEDQKKEVPE